MSRNAARLSAVTVKGGLWGADLLVALAEDPTSLPKGTASPDSYGLPRRSDIPEVTRGQWPLLKAAWEEFSERHAQKVETDGERYGSDDFSWKTWTTHLLTVLGYAPEKVIGGLSADSADPDDPADTYPITHLHHDQVPVHAVPAGAPLDRRSKRVQGASGQSPHSLVQDYLNRTDAHLWAVITNGLTLRIVRDNAAMARQAYIEFDLPAIFDTESYSDFELLWRACHATRFTYPADGQPTDCIAEAWQGHAVKTGVAALDDLQAGVETAIAELGQGLIEHHANTALRVALDATEGPDADFDAAALFQELLYVAYQHVFWFTLDDRDLLFPSDTDPDKKALYRDHYGSAQLRNRARRHLGGNHPDAWHGTRLLASWFADPDGQPALDIPALLGDLWSTSATPHLAGTTLTNRRYFEAIRRLGYVLRDGVLNRINYDAMGSEELGAVYESLLEIIPTVDTQTRTFSLGRAAGSDRKKSGSYYTPTSLIELVLDEALDPVVAERLAAAGTDQVAREHALLDLTVCDPTMGSAHFLVGAGMRLAKHLAAVRIGEPEPAPEVVNQAFRDVAARCLYGVDVNPPAVALAKVAIWLECHVPGQPLTFLDHHLRHGDALLGFGFDQRIGRWSRERGEGGVPDAAFATLEGDDPAAARQLAKVNAKRREGQVSLFSEFDHVFDPTALANTARQIASMDDSDPDLLAAKRDAWTVYGSHEDLVREQLRADAWTGCWTMQKTPGLVGCDDTAFEVFYDSHYSRTPAPDRPGVRAARDEARRHAFFHWHTAFPEIAGRGGFDVIVGNPPWAPLATNEQTWFGTRGRPDIAGAKNQSARGKLLDQVRESTHPADVRLIADWDAEVRRIELLSHWTKRAGRLNRPPVKLELSAVFANVFLSLVAHNGRVGLLCRESVFTGKTNSDFAQWLIRDRRLAAFYMFENEDKIFPEVDNTRKFAALTMLGTGQTAESIGLTGFIRQPADVDNPDRRYDLTVEEIGAINPHTLGIPIFRDARDAGLAAHIHSTHPVLCPDGDTDPGPYGVHYQQGTFNMSSDSGSFIDHGVAVEGPRRPGREIVRTLPAGIDPALPNGGPIVPLHEGKMIWLYDHRYGTYENRTQKQANKNVLPPMPGGRHEDPDAEPQHQYWVSKALNDAQIPAHWDRDWVIGFRSKGTLERTMLISVLPRTGAGHPMPFLLPMSNSPRQTAFLVATLSSLVCDYAIRFKGLFIHKYVLAQAPVPRPPSETDEVPWGGEGLLDFVVPRVVELSATTTSTAGFAEDCGLTGPYRWDEDRRPVIQAELDALMFHLYRLDRKQVEWVLQTFRNLRQNEEKPPAKGGLGEYRTRRLVLEEFDRMTTTGRSVTAHG